MFKHNAESEPHTSKQERQDSMALKKRAADDARKDADSFASHIRPQHDKTGRPSGLDLVAELFCPRPERAGAGSPDGINGLLTYVVAGTASDDLLEIFLAAEVEALAAQSARIYSNNHFWPGKYIKWMNQVL
jgi:hypothetical protein